jgi:uncharacterized protein involved in outer membrane biogenesis
VTVAGHDPATPLLTIRRVRAEISLGAALKKEFVVKSLTIEKPVVTIVRGADGRLNLPGKMGSSREDVESSAKGRGASDASSATPPTQDGEGTWKLDAQKVLVVDGEVHYRDASGYHASVEQLLAELKQSGGGFDFTLIADSTGRRDQPANLGQIRANGRVDHLRNPAQWRNARAHGNLEVSDVLRVKADVPALDPVQAKLEFSGKLNLADVAAFLPSAVKGADVLRSGAVRGHSELSGRATYGQREGLRIPELTIRAIDVILSRASAAT